MNVSASPKVSPSSATMPLLPTNVASMSWRIDVAMNNWSTAASAQATTSVIITGVFPKTAPVATWRLILSIAAVVAIDAISTKYASTAPAKPLNVPRIRVKFPTTVISSTLHNAAKRSFVGL